VLIILNGLPGVGKLTIGHILAERTKARLLDNHTIYNVAFALTDFKSAMFYEAAKRAHCTAYDIVRMLPPGETIIITDIFTEGSAWAKDCWDRAVNLAETHGPLVLVNMYCELAENMRRVQQPERRSLRKLDDPEVLREIHGRGRKLMGDELPTCLTLDTTHLPAVEVADMVQEWVQGISDGPDGSADPVPFAKINRE
jgi:shikimate kinase